MKRFFFLLLLWILMPQGARAQSRLQDSLALVDLYNATGGANWTNRTNWLTANPIDTWYGITTTQGRVTCISFGSTGCFLTGANITGIDNNLRGTLPATLNNLSNLQYLNLSGIYIRGSIPNLNLPNLNKLSLSSTGLSGNIPNFNLPNLEELYLSQNSSLSGSIPNFNLPKLSYLDLSYDRLSGSIPNFNLPKLSYLDLSYDRLSGSIPNFNLPNLQQLDLSSNALSGTIPNFNLPNLWQLDLSSNALSGTIPNFNLPNLSYLYLSHNQLSGIIPNFNLPKLLKLYLNTNQLSGSIPNFILPKLKELSLGANQLSGSIPNFNLPNLSDLSLHTNQLSGSIPNFNFPNLSYLYLNNNQLSGSIPNFNLPNLFYLYLHTNQLSGSIPNFNLPNLSDLYLNTNQLSGSIPNFNFPNLSNLYLNTNQLSGSIPNFILPKLLKLYLNTNQLSGSIPNFILPKLKELSLGANQLSDTIPNFNLPNLTALTLLNNQLIGCVPAGIKTNCPLIGVNGGNISANANLLTQNWSNYWSNGEGACRTITNSTMTASQCGTRNYQLPSGRIVNSIGVYSDTIYHTGFISDTIFTVTLTNDVSCRCTDSLQLVTLYNATGGANWTNRTNWLSNNPISTWYGIITNAQGCVTRISLASNRLMGSLPNLDMPNLQDIQFFNNQLSGSIPNFNLPNLTTLGLSVNQLTGTIPNFNLPNLRDLFLHTNQLSGSIPNFNLPNLQSLYLYSNQLSGSIPNFNLPNLQTLSLGTNQLSGTIPNFNLPNLQYLYLYSNQLSGSIPNFNLPNLQQLGLAGNQLIGNIPNFNLPNLRGLYLPGNQLSGSIPNFNNLPNLEQLALYYNQLTGSMPNFNFPMAIYISVGSNQLSGTVPVLLQCPSLQRLYLDNNKFAGVFPESFANFTRLKHLWLHNNQLTLLPNLSNLPIEVITASNNEGLRVQSNQLTFEDVLPNIPLVTSATFYYAPQDSIYIDTTITKYIGNTWTLNLGIDGAITTNKYKWYKNGVLFDSTTVNQLIINNLQTTHAGVYTCRVTNPNAPLLTLYSRRITVQVGCAPARDTTLSATLCTGRNYTLPSGKIKNGIGVYPDTVRSRVNPTCDSLRFTVTLTNDVSCRCTDSLALVDLYNATTGAGWTNRTNWLTANPINTWYGITTNAQGCVTCIDLDGNLNCSASDPLTGNGLQGTLPNISMSALTSFTLARNRLNGNIPNFTCPNLQVLDLYSNQLTGSIPNFNLPNLNSLGLSVNQLTGTIPNFNLPNLRQLFLHTNQLSGSIPNFNLPNLTDLYLNNNQLSGSIPNFNLPNLTILGLASNQLSGSIPNFTLPNLRLLNLGTNQLSGTIPNLNLLNLLELQLNNNQLNGMIPNFNLPNLQNLILYNNQLSGNIPTMTLPKLQYLQIERNQLTGVLSTNFQNTDSLRTLTFYSNRIDSVSNLSALTRLTTFGADTNRITFDDILPNLARGMTYRKQDSIFTETAYSKYTGDALTINLGIDAAITTNVYKWYKNGTLFQTNTGNNKLIFNNLALTDAGIYTCQVTNPNAPNLTLYSRKATLNVALSCRTSDSLALVDLYNATNGANWTNRTNWLSSNPISTWYGITTNAQGCVTCIDLDGDANCHLAQGSGNGLRGNLPNLNIPTLTFLSLANNALTGTVPNFNLPNLVRLALQNNQLSGNIPNFALPSLVTLYLHQNQLTGNIPNFNLANLAFLWLDANRLTGNLPDLSATNLTQLLLNDNQLTGSIPNFNFSQLQTLRLSNNQLTGNIPTFNLPNLSVLNLSSNQLSGTIPMLNLPKLSDFRLHQNRLTGMIPNFRADSLRFFRFYKNELDSVSVLTGFTRLSVCVGDTNRFTFDDILPNLGRGITYTKQDSIFRDTTYTRNAGQSLTIDLGIDGALTTNVYKWYKNGTLFQTTSVNQLIFNALQTTDAGLYTCQVTNPNAPLLTLYSRKATVNVNCALLAVPQTKPICQGSSYTLRNGRTYSISGTYRDTIGCDTIYVINLVVNRRDSIELPKITRCYGADTTPVITRRTNLYGCDSIRVQRFRWAPALATVRLPIEYDCNLVRSVQDTNKIKNIAGCDSVWKIRTRIAVPKYNIELPLQYRCNPADTFRKIQQLTTRSYGCDSIITQRFILARPYLLDTTIWVCAPRDTATKIQRLRTYLGCDSTVIKRYVLARKDIKRLPDIIVCYARDTNTIRKSFLNRFGCDSTIIQRFRLEQHDTTILTETVCDTLFERTDTIPIRTKTKCEAIQIKHFVFQHCECLAKTAVFNGLIPNDGDAKNDVFLFDNIERFTPNELIITDKRNMLMYQVKNYKNDWSGTNQKGEPLPAGVYNYWFSITHPKTGEKCSRVGVVDIKYIP